MTAIDDAGRLVRLGLALQLREAALAPVLTAAAVTPGKPIAVGASTHSRRLDLVLPYHPSALAAVAPNASPPADADGLRITLEGEAITAAIVLAGSPTPRTAIDALAAAPVRAAWFDLVDQMCAIAGGRIVRRTWQIDRARVSIEVGYPARGRDTDQIVLAGIDQLAEDLGITAPQRRLWSRIHPALGRGGEISVTTRATEAAVSPTLAIGYPINGWDVAIRLADGLTLDEAKIQPAIEALGRLAGVLGDQPPSRIEFVLGPTEPPEIVVWLQLLPNTFG